MFGRPLRKCSAECWQVQNVLGTPAPKVYAWSSRAQDNAVGTEYIIMEKLPSVQLDVVWAVMIVEDRLAIINALAQCQKAWISCPFDRIGSLYYSNNLDETTHSHYYTDSHGVKVTDHRFAVSPSTGRYFSDDRRSLVEFDRGPCKTCRENPSFT